MRSSRLMFLGAVIALLSTPAGADEGILLSDNQMDRVTAGSTYEIVIVWPAAGPYQFADELWGRETRYTVVGDGRWRILPNSFCPICEPGDSGYTILEDIPIPTNGLFQIRYDLGPRPEL